MSDVERVDQQTITEQEIDLPQQRMHPPEPSEQERWRYRSAVDVARALNKH